MSRIKKEIKELLELAKLTNDESVFQQNHRYKKFKDKYHVDMDDYVPELMIGLNNNNFCNESVFWAKKIIENTRVCDKENRASLHKCMVTYFYRLKDFENVLDHGKKFLEYDKLLLYTPSQLERKKIVLILMRFASDKLNMKQKAMKYTKEYLKILVAQYNANEIEKHELLIIYYDLIDFQIQLGDSKSAKKIIDKRLTLFNLNSMHPNDVLLSMKEEGYEKILPLAIFISNDDGHCIQEFKKNLSSVESYQHWWEMVKIFFHVGKICWQKHIFGYSCPSNMTWGNVSFKVYCDILYHSRIHLKLNGQCDTEISDEDISAFAKFVNKVLNATISAALLLADNDHLRRAEIFSTLFKVLFSSEHGILMIGGIKKISYYITEIQQANNNIDGKRVMPFIQFCLKSLNENGVDTEWANILTHENLDLRMQFLTLKNSLTIMNHFKTNGNKEEY